MHRRWEIAQHALISLDAHHDVTWFADQMRGLTLQLVHAGDVTAVGAHCSRRRCKIEVHGVRQRLIPGRAETAIHKYEMLEIGWCLFGGAGDCPQTHQHAAIAFHHQDAPVRLRQRHTQPERLRQAHRGEDTEVQFTLAERQPIDVGAADPENDHVIVADAFAQDLHRVALLHALQTPSTFRPSKATAGCADWYAYAARSSSMPICRGSSTMA